MKVTKEYVEQKFCEYNERIFGGELPALEVRLTSARTFLGKLRYEKKRRLLWGSTYKNVQLVISTRYDLPEDVVQDTIIHEMIHYVILHRGLKDTSTHGKVFREMMSKINRQYGRHVTVRVRLPEDVINKDTRRRQHLLCVSHFVDGRVGVTLASPSRLAYLQRTLHLIEDIRRCTWYTTTNPFFNRFPRSLTPKVYLVDEDELQENIKGALPMECR